MSDRFRILHVIGGSEFGGAVWIVLSYIHMLQEHGCEVVVVSSNDSVGEIYNKAGCNVISSIEIRRNINLFRDFVATMKLANVCRRYRFHAVHTHTSKGGFVGRAAARLAGVPIILHTSHGFAFNEFSSSITVWAYKTLERLAARWCDRIITVSNFHREWALRLGIARPEKIVAIQNGISADRMVISRDADQVRREFGISPEDKLIGVICRLVPQKGLKSLLGAMSLVFAGEPHAKLLLVGKGPIEEELREEVRRRKIIDHVVFAGFRADIGNIINACDIIVSPTLYEGLSVSLLEAMALGKAIITTDISSNRELILDRDCGMLVQANNPNALAEAIMSLVNDKHYMIEYGIAAKIRYEKFFTEEEMKGKLLNVYRDLFDEKLNMKLP